MTDQKANAENGGAGTEAVWDQLINKPSSTESSAEPDGAAPTQATARQEGPVGTGAPDPETRLLHGQGESGELLPSDADDMGDMMDAAELKLDDVQRTVRSIQQTITSRLESDAYKDQIIERLHQELQGYKEDLSKKQIKPIIMDLIQFMDNIRKLTDYYRKRGIFGNDPEKLLKLLIHIPADLEDICGRNGVFPFQCDSDTFDPSRQRILKRIATTDKVKDKSVAKSLRPGYEWDGQIIRPEMVAVYVCKANDEPGERNE